MERVERLLKSEGILPTPLSVKKACGERSIAVIPGPQIIELISYDDKFCQIIQYFAGCIQTTSITESSNPENNKIILIEESLILDGLEISNRTFQIPKSIYQNPNLQYNLTLGNINEAMTHELQRLHGIHSTIENFSHH